MLTLQVNCNLLLNTGFKTKGFGNNWKQKMVGRKSVLQKEVGMNYNSVIILTRVHFKTVMLPSSLLHTQENAIRRADIIT